MIDGIASIPSEAIDEYRDGARTGLGPQRMVPELYCSDLARSLSFWTDVLGFIVLYDRPEERFAFLDRNGAQLMIEEPVDPTRTLGSAAMTPPLGRGMNLQVDVEDVDRLHRVAAEAGVAIVLPLEECTYRRGGGSVTVRQFVVADPDGYLIRLSQLLGAR